MMKVIFLLPLHTALTQKGTHHGVKDDFNHVPVEFINFLNLYRHLKRN
jgi:hypothetical protein